jgi:16S rRNA processing protein RimM
VGRVGRPHGTRGAFTVSDPSDRPGVFVPGRLLLVGDRELEVVAVQGTDAHPILTVVGVGDRDAARGLRGEVIGVPRDALGALAEGEFMVADLVGCEVVDGERRIGRVRDVLHLPSADALEVEREGAEDLLVPLVGDAVRSIDVDARRIDVNAGFLDAQ